MDYLKLNGVSISSPAIQKQRFCGAKNHPFELYLALGDIERRRTKIKSSQASGFIERFSQTVLDKFSALLFG